MRLLLPLLVLLVIAALVPIEILFYSERGLATALLHQDRAALDTWIDWPAVRTRLKQDFGERVAGETPHDPDVGRRVAGVVLGALATGIVDQGVDQLADSKSLTTFLRNAERFAPAHSTAGRLARDPGSIFVAWDHWGRFDAEGRYEVALDQDGDEPPIRVVFAWESLTAKGWRWRVVRIIPGATVLDGGR